MSQYVFLVLPHNNGTAHGMQWQCKHQTYKTHVISWHPPPAIPVPSTRWSCRLSWTYAMLLHVIGDLPGNFCQDLFRQVRLARCQIVAIATTNELPEWDKLKQRVGYLVERVTDFFIFSYWLHYFLAVEPWPTKHIALLNCI